MAKKFGLTDEDVWHTNKIQAEEIGRLRAELQKTQRALRTAHDTCRDGTLLSEVKLLEIYHAVTSAMDPMVYTLSDMRTGRRP